MHVFLQVITHLDGYSKKIKPISKIPERSPRKTALAQRASERMHNQKLEETFLFFGFSDGFHTEVVGGTELPLSVTVWIVQKHGAVHTGAVHSGFLLRPAAQSPADQQGCGVVVSAKHRGN